MVVSSPDSYVIWILNRSGVTASYALVHAPPFVSPTVDANDIHTPIISSFRSVPSGNGLVRMEIPKQIYACCGTSLRDRSGCGAAIEIFDHRPIICTSCLDDGTIHQGKSLSMVVDHGQPAFARDGTQIEQDKSFSIRTQPDFTIAEARNKGYFVGICGPWRGIQARRNLGFYSTFTPTPNTAYTIQPRPIFGILLGDFQPRSLLDRSADEICHIDFARLGTDDVEIVHTDRNELIIVTNPLLYSEISL